MRRYAGWFVLEILERRLNKDNAPDAKAKERFILLHESSKQSRDPDELRDEALSILSAGRSTTVSFMSWVFYFLVRNPEVFDKFHSIILTECGTDYAAGPISFQMLMSCQYLQSCINESLRLSPVIPLNTRYSKKDTTLPRGGGSDGTSFVFVPNGLQVFYPLFDLHHRADIWGTDVDDFKPDCWNGRKIRCEFVPFGGAKEMLRW